MDFDHVLQHIKNTVRPVKSSVMEDPYEIEAEQLKVTVAPDM